MVFTMVKHLTFFPKKTAIIVLVSSVLFFHIFGFFIFFISSRIRIKWKILRHKAGLVYEKITFCPIMICKKTFFVIVGNEIPRSIVLLLVRPTVGFRRWFFAPGSQTLIFVRQLYNFFTYTFNTQNLKQNRYYHT